MRRRNDRVATLEAELERRLQELEHRESALKKISAALMARRPAPASPDVEARLLEVRHRESALKRISEVVERRRDELDGQLQDAAERVRHADEQVSDLLGRLEERSARVVALESELGAATQQAERARGLETELHETQLQLEERGARIAGLEAQLAGAAGEAERATRDADARVEELHAHLEQRVARLDALEQELVAAHHEADRARALEPELRTAQEHVARLVAELGHAQSELEKAQARRGLFRRRPPVPEPVVDTTRVTELEAEAAALRDRIVELERAAPTPAPVAPVAEPEPEPEPEPDLDPPLVLKGRPTLPQLEHMAAEAGRRGMPQAEEWTVYAGLLRGHAGSNGSIPRDFDDLVRDVFGAWD